jgi:hypothetical protein
VFSEGAQYLAPAGPRDPQQGITVNNMLATCSSREVAWLIRPRTSPAFMEM